MFIHSGTAADATAATTCTIVHSVSPALLLFLVVVTVAAALMVLAFLELVQDFSVRSYLSIRLFIMSYRSLFVSL